MLKFWDLHHPDLDIFKKDGRQKRGFFIVFIRTTIKKLLQTRDDIQPHDYYLFQELKDFIEELKLKSNEAYEIKLIEQDIFYMELELKGKPVCPFKAKGWPSEEIIETFSWSERGTSFEKQKYHKQWLKKLRCLLAELEGQGWDLDIWKNKLMKMPDSFFKSISFWILSVDSFHNPEEDSSLTIDDIPWIKIQPAATPEAKEILLKLKKILFQYKYLMDHIF